MCESNTIIFEEEIKTPLESQLEDLSNRLRGDQKVFEWLGRALLYEDLAIAELRRVGLNHLADFGLNCIKEKFPCPNSPKKRSLRRRKI